MNGDGDAYRKLQERFAKVIAISDKYQAEAYETAVKLKRASERLARLERIAPTICACCRTILDADDWWDRVARYYAERPDLLLSEATCAGCAAARLAELPPGRKTPAPEKYSARIARRALSGTRRAPSDKRASDTPLLARLRERLRSSSPDDPINADFAALLARYEKQDARLEKIISISDVYQEQLRDISTRMELMAYTDFLTNLPNRRAMIDRLEIELARAERYGTTFSVVLFDVDDFKKVNDVWGHDSGDEVLKRTAKELQGAIRRSDSCGRWGGEEFLALLAESGEDEAFHAGEKGRIAVERAVTVSRKGEIGVTVSGGVCSYRRGMDVDALLMGADAALYEAKAAGKNRLSVRTYI